MTEQEINKSLTYPYLRYSCAKTMGTDYHKISLYENWLREEGIDHSKFKNICITTNVIDLMKWAKDKISKAQYDLLFNSYIGRQLHIVIAEDGTCLEIKPFI